MNGGQKKKQVNAAGRAEASRKTAGSGQMTTFQGIKIDNDPLEREIYVRCPACGNRVFDSALDN